MLGVAVGNYTVTGTIGRGGMSAIYLARHALLGREVAVKVLLPELSRQPEMVDRFFTEARAVTTIRHPGVIEVYDFGYLEDGGAYIVMELLEGETLSSRLTGAEPLSIDWALGIGRQLAAALGAAHEQGVVHRDLKPDNIFLVEDPETPGAERLKLLDFGIARMTRQPRRATSTEVGVIIGTPEYMAPEQCRGHGEIDHRTDLYALGCVMYQMICGRLPFVADGCGELVAAHLSMPPPSPRSVHPAVTPALESLLLRLLAKSPDDRPASAAEVIEEIDAIRLRLQGDEAGAMVVEAAVAAAADARMSGAADSSDDGEDYVALEIGGDDLGIRKVDAAALIVPPKPPRSVIELEPLSVEMPLGQRWQRSAALAGLMALVLGAIGAVVVAIILAAYDASKQSAMASGASAAGVEIVPDFPHAHAGLSAAKPVAADESATFTSSAAPAAKPAPAPTAPRRAGPPDRSSARAPARPAVTKPAAVRRSPTGRVLLDRNGGINPFD
jgi:tRNA A-37 threonylcarbamoyl transferase component Bud32